MNLTNYYIDKNYWPKLFTVLTDSLLSSKPSCHRSEIMQGSFFYRHWTFCCFSKTMQNYRFHVGDFFFFFFFFSVSFHHFKVKNEKTNPFLNKELHQLFVLSLPLIVPQSKFSPPGFRTIYSDTNTSSLKQNLEKKTNPQNIKTEKYKCI